MVERYQINEERTTEELVKMYSDAVEKNDQETCSLVDQELFERDMYIWYDPQGKFVAKKH